MSSDLRKTGAIHPWCWFLAGWLPPLIWGVVVFYWARPGMPPPMVPVLAVTGILILAVGFTGRTAGSAIARGAAVFTALWAAMLLRLGKPDGDERAIWVFLAIGLFAAAALAAAASRIRTRFFPDA